VNEYEAAVWIFGITMIVVMIISVSMIVASVKKANARVKQILSKEIGTNVDQDNFEDR
jgi:hypothetical protein